MRNWAGTALLLSVVAVGMMGSGCSASSATSPTSPTAAVGGPISGPVTIGALSTGTWSSTAGDALPGGLNLNPGACGNFKWSVTSLTAVGAAGTFSADCGGGLSLAGTATASLSGTGAVWGANGNVTGSATCSFVVTGTAALENDGVRVTYNATVCGVSISGSELLKKR